MSKTANVQNTYIYSCLISYLEKLGWQKRQMYTQHISTQYVFILEQKGWQKHLWGYPGEYCPSVGSKEQYSPGYPLSFSIYCINITQLKYKHWDVLRMYNSNKCKDQTVRLFRQLQTVTTGWPQDHAWPFSHRPW